MKTTTTTTAKTITRVLSRVLNERFPDVWILITNALVLYDKFERNIFAVYDCSKKSLEDHHDSHRANRKKSRTDEWFGFNSRFLQRVV